MHTARPLLKSFKVLYASVLICFSMSTSAIIIGPIHDPLNMIENLAKEMADLESRLADEVERIAKRELKKELKKAVGIESSERQATEQIAEEKRSRNLRNHEVANQNMPSSGFCDNVYIINGNGDFVQTERSKNSILTFAIRAEAIQNSICESLFESQKEERNLALPNFLNKDRAGAAQKQDEQITKVIEELEDNKLSVDDIMPHTMTGLIEEEYEDAIFKAKLMFPPIESNETASFNNKSDFLINSSNAMRSMLPYQTQVEQISEKRRPSENIHSERESQIEFAADFFNSENIETYAFNNMILPSQVERDKAIMTAFLVHMALQRYKSSLDKELLLSVKIIEKMPD